MNQKAKARDEDERDDKPKRSTKLAQCPETHDGFQCRLNLGHEGPHDAITKTDPETAISWPNTSVQALEAEQQEAEAKAEAEA